MAPPTWKATGAFAALVVAAPAAAAPVVLERPALTLRRDSTPPPASPAVAALWQASPATSTPGLVWWLGPGAESLILRIKVRVYPFYGAQTMGVRADWTF